jgi:hypothetical protein
MPAAKAVGTPFAPICLPLGNIQTQNQLQAPYGLTVERLSCAGQQSRLLMMGPIYTVAQTLESGPDICDAASNA